MPFRIDEHDIPSIPTRTNPLGGNEMSRHRRGYHLFVVEGRLTEAKRSKTQESGSPGESAHSLRNSESRNLVRLRWHNAMGQPPELADKPPSINRVACRRDRSADAIVPGAPQDPRQDPRNPSRECHVDTKTPNDEKPNVDRDRPTGARGVRQPNQTRTTKPRASNQFSIANAQTIPDGIEDISRLSRREPAPKIPEHATRRAHGSRS